MGQCNRKSPDIRRFNFRIYYNIAFSADGYISITKQLLFKTILPCSISILNQNRPLVNIAAAVTKTKARFERFFSLSGTRLYVKIIENLFAGDVRMEIKNKKINFLGDSITEGHGVAEKKNFFSNRLLRDVPLAAARNYGIGGTRIAPQNCPSENPDWDKDFLSRYKDMDDDADIVVVLGGTNDFGHGDAPFGSFEDRTPETFCGACHILMSGLMTKYVGSTVVFMTPLHRIEEDSPRGSGSKKVDSALLIDYVRMIRRIAEYYAIPMLDLYSSSGIQPKVPALREAYCPDGLHPNDAGHKLIADRLRAFLESL